MPLQSCLKGVTVNRKISLSLTVCLMALTAAVTFVLTLSFSQKRFNQTVSEVDRLAQKYQLLDELDAKIQQEYYTDIPEQDVINGMLEGYVDGLGDKYSAYRSATEYAAYEDNNAGVYTGVGMSVRKLESGEAEIVSVTPDGSAEKAGIETGDILISVDGTLLTDGYAEAIKLIEGEVGTTVTLTVRKHDSGNEKSYTVTRAKIEETTVEFKMLENHIGYIRIKKFRTVSVTQFSNAMTELREKGAEQFIFDVRNNGGGVVSALESMVDPLLPEGELAFATDKHGNSTTILKSDAEQLEVPMVILVNGNSASAAELFACVLRDYAGAKLVGEKTFGKGIMQTTFPLSTGAVTLTTATYETGITPCYHGIGLEPDVLSIPAEDSEEDTQLTDAINTLLAQQNADAA